MPSLSKQTAEFRKYGATSDKVRLIVASGHYEPVDTTGLGFYPALCSAEYRGGRISFVRGEKLALFFDYKTERQMPHAEEKLICRSVRTRLFYRRRDRVTIGSVNSDGSILMPLLAYGARAREDNFAEINEAAGGPS
jgi:hypothetical protein